MNYLTKTFSGIAFRPTPFIANILVPQLKQRGLAITTSTAFSSIQNKPPDFILTEATVVQRHLNPQQQENLKNFLLNKSIGIAFCTSRDYKEELDLLSLGFTHCIKLPAATEVIVKTIENTMQLEKPRNTYREPTTEYVVHKDNAFSYLFDNSGHPFLLCGKHAIHLNICEKRLLDYLCQRKGIVAMNELAFAGWRDFRVKTNTVVAAVKKLRDKMCDAKIPYSIRSVYGYGYSLESNSEINN